MCGLNFNWFTFSRKVLRSNGFSSTEKQRSTHIPTPLNMKFIREMFLGIQFSWLFSHFVLLFGWCHPSNE
jgi:hypothetical protein